MKPRLAMLALLPLVAACQGGRDTDAPRLRVQGDSAHGAVLIKRYQCGSCHTIPGIYGARGVVGPPLYFFARRTYIAGELPNTPANLQRWLLDPPAVEPNTAMPRLGLDRAEARDIAAYLSTLR